IASSSRAAGENGQVRASRGEARSCQSSGPRGLRKPSASKAIRAPLAAEAQEPQPMQRPARSIAAGDKALSLVRSGAISGKGVAQSGVGRGPQGGDRPGYFRRRRAGQGGFEGLRVADKVPVGAEQSGEVGELGRTVV